MDSPSSPPSGARWCSVDAGGTLPSRTLRPGSSTSAWSRGRAGWPACLLAGGLSALAAMVYVCGLRRDSRGVEGLWEWECWRGEVGRIRLRVAVRWALRGFPRTVLGAAECRSFFGSVNLRA